MCQDWSGGIYLFLPHGGQTGWGPWGHGRDTHLSGHLAHAAHAAGCHVGGHRHIVEVHTIAIVHVAVTLLGELWWCLLLWEHTGGEGRCVKEVSSNIYVGKKKRNFKAYLPVATYVALRPAIHVRGALESGVSLALLHHRGLRVGHAGRKQGALWCAGTSKASVCLLAHTCGRCIEEGQPNWTRRDSTTNQCTECS